MPRSPRPVDGAAPGTMDGCPPAAHSWNRMSPFCRLVALLGCVLMLGCAAWAGAARLYTSRDANGNLVFSDRPLAGTQVVWVRQVEVAKGPCCSVVNRGRKDDVVLVAINDCYGPAQAGFDLEEEQNISSDRPRHFTAVVPARQERTLVRLKPANPRLAYRYRYSHRLVIGDPAARHLPPQPYLLPVPAAERFRISQAFGGSATHTDAQNYYAVDIPMPQGTPICAARGGVIMEVANDFLSGGIGSGYQEKANFIRILHDDGTMAIYAHLQAESIRYPAGTRVARGAVIAASGNTGYTSGPHLHFAVQQNSGMELRSIPFTFADTGGHPYAPEQGMAVYR